MLSGSSTGDDDGHDRRTRSLYIHAAMACTTNRQCACACRCVAMVGLRPPPPSSTRRPRSSEPTSEQGVVVGWHFSSTEMSDGARGVPPCARV